MLVYHILFGLEKKIQKKANDRYLFNNQNQVLIVDR